MLKTQKNKMLIPEEHKHGDGNKKAPSSSVENTTKKRCLCKEACKDAHGGTDCIPQNATPPLANIKIEDGN